MYVGNAGCTGCIANIEYTGYTAYLIERNFRTCVKGNFTTFPFLQLRLNDIDLWWEYEDYCIKKYKTK